MGAFVLGILVGWLAEWLFFTFFIKGGNTSDCSSIKAELEEKKREISALQGKLENATATKAAAISSSSTQATTSQSSKKPAATAAQTSKKPATPKKEAAPKKAAPKKAAAKPAKKAAPKGKAKAGGDDFTKLSGIGPSMAGTLKSLGIDTFEKLAATDDDILRDMLEASGARLNNNKEAMDSWNEQATLAAKGDFDELKKMQQAMKK